MNAIRDHEAPLSSATIGHLEFVRGAANVTLDTDPEMENLYRAHFEGTAPKVEVEDGSVIFRYSWRFLDWRKRGAEVMLNARVPWGIAVGGGLYKLNADL